MLRSKFAAVFAVLAALTLFFGGMLTYKLAAGNAQTTGATALGRASAHHEGLTIEGRVTMQVLRGGRIVAAWKGHNSIYAYGQNAIAGCLSGATTTPAPFGKCSGFITRITLTLNSAYASGWRISGAATNTVTPAGCDPQGFQTCTGWDTSATVPVTDNGTITYAAATNDNTNWFDQAAINPNLAVQTGDSVQVKISFTVA